METFTRDGLTFDVRDAGPADGPAVVCLHGFPQDARSFDAVVPGLVAAGFRVLAPDQRGYSPRARPPGRPAYVLRELVGEDAARKGGYVVHTSIDLALERSAREAMVTQLGRIDERNGYRGPLVRARRPARKREPRRQVDPPAERQGPGAPLVLGTPYEATVVSADDAA